MWYAGAIEALFEATATGRAMAKGRSLSQFQETFPDEASCAAFLLERRWPEGFVCPGCGEQRAAALKSRAYTYECLDCGRQTSATAGTVMHRSKLPLTTWFWAAHLMATHSNGMSARQFGRSTRRHLQDRVAADAETAPVDGRPGSRSLGGRRRSRSGGNSLPGRRRLFRARQCRQNPRRRGRRGDRSRHQSAQAATQARQIPRYALWANTPRYGSGGRLAAARRPPE